MEIELKDAFDRLVKELESDDEYRYGWISNIAMAYIDAESQYRKGTKKRTLNRMDKHNIANTAAKNFISLLIKK